jgi:CheY-like chemotaxis protein
MAFILIVDDHPDSCEPVRRVLQRSGHQVDVALNGSEALQRLSASSPDVVLLDLMMPVMDGVTFLQTIRSYMRWQDLPVVVLTASGDSLLVQRAMSFKVASVFRKGNVSLAELLDCINRVVSPPAGLPSEN